MENAAQALKNAAAILIFIMAIAVSFSLFGTAKQTADSIIKMRDKQAYLDAVELDTVLYTSSSEISKGSRSVSGITSEGHRIVGIDDVLSTIKRYSIENYAVTIIINNNKILRRYDRQMEENWYKLENENKEDYKKKIKSNIALATRIEVTSYEEKFLGDRAINFTSQDEIQQMINQEFSTSLCEILKDKEIVEITKEIDNSKYLTEGEGEGQVVTDLLQQHEMSSVEIIYVIKK